MSEDAHARNRAQYGAVAANYATSESHATGDDLAWFAARAAAVPTTRALDVACGGGFSTRALAAAGHDVLATDLTPESVAAARAATEAPVGWAAGAAERLPVRTGAFGLVTCRIAPHHFADVAAFVDEVARALRPGGTFLLVDTTVPLDEDLARWLDDVERLRDPSHQRSWPPSRWRAVVSGARLDVEETQLFRKRHPIEPWLARSGCAGDRAAQVREVFATAPDNARQAYLIDAESFTDTKMCLRARKP